MPQITALNLLTSLTDDDLFCGVDAPATTALASRFTVLTARAALLAPGTNAQTGTSYTLVLADAWKRVEMGNASSNTLTVPLNSSVAFPVGTQIDVIQTGAGTTTIAATGGVTINSRGGLLGSAGQWAGMTLVKRATDTWWLGGDLA